MKDALKVITKQKNFGVLIARNTKKITTGIITDGQIRRVSQKNKDLQNLTVKDVYTKNPISVDKDMLAAKALQLMNSKKITILCVNNKKSKNKTQGIIHLHHILSANVQ
jgi:arabinose-5-phosphate isomerase